MTVSHVAGSTGCDQKPAENGRSDLLRRVHTVASLLCTAQAQRERPHRYDAELFGAAGLRDVGTCWVGMRSASIPWPTRQRLTRWR